MNIWLLIAIGIIALALIILMVDKLFCKLLHPINHHQPDGLPSTLEDGINSINNEFKELDIQVQGDKKVFNPSIGEMPPLNVLCYFYKDKTKAYQNMGSLVMDADILGLDTLKVVSVTGNIYPASDYCKYVIILKGGKMINTAIYIKGGLTCTIQK